MARIQRNKAEGFGEGAHGSHPFGSVGAELVAAQRRRGPADVWLALIIDTALLLRLRHVKCWPDWHSTEWHATGPTIVSRAQSRDRNRASLHPLRTPHGIRKNTRRPRRRPHRGDQPVAGRRGAGGAPLQPGRRTFTARCHGVRGIVDEELCRPDPGDQPQPGAGGQHALQRPGLNPRQARRRLLPARFSRCCRRTRSATSSTSAATTPPTRCTSSTRKRKGRATTCAASTSPRPSTTTWSSNDHTPGFPSAARFVAQAFGRQPRQPRAARRVDQRGHGPARRLPDRRLRAGQEVPGRRPAPDLPARARL